MQSHTISHVIVKVCSNCSNSLNFEVYNFFNLLPGTPVIYQGGLRPIPTAPLRNSFIFWHRPIWNDMNYIYIHIISYIHICAILSIMAFESNWNPSHVLLKVDIHLIIINILICYLQWHFLRAGDEIAMRDLYIPPLGLIGCATWTKPKPFSGRVFQVRPWDITDILGTESLTSLSFEVLAVSRPDVFEESQDVLHWWTRSGANSHAMDSRLGGTLSHATGNQADMILVLVPSRTCTSNEDCKG